MNDRDFAIVIGINGYSALTPLRGAHEDAVKFKNWVTDPDGGGLPDSDTNVRIILSNEGTIGDPFDATPIKRDVDIALRDFGLAGNFETGIGRRLYFYFSGHGVGPDFNDVAMLMADATPSQLNNNIGMGPYWSMLKKTARFEEIIFILDCCRDAVSNVESSKPAITPPIPHVPGPHHPTEDFIIMATGWGEKAYERPIEASVERARLGVLTDTLIKGLNDSSTADSNGKITSETLRLYLLEKMSADQTPDFKRPSRKEIVFKTIPQPPPISCRILSSAGVGHSGNIVIRTGSFVEISSRPANLLTRNDPPWIVDLRPKTVYLIQFVPTNDAGKEPAIIQIDENNEYHFTKFD